MVSQNSTKQTLSLDSNADLAQELSHLLRYLPAMSNDTRLLLSEVQWRLENTYFDRLKENVEFDDLACYTPDASDDRLLNVVDQCLVNNLVLSTSSRAQEFVYDFAGKLMQKLRAVISASDVDDFLNNTAFKQVLIQYRKDDTRQFRIICAYPQARQSSVHDGYIITSSGVQPMRFFFEDSEEQVLQHTDFPFWGSDYIYKDVAINRTTQLNTYNIWVIPIGTGLRYIKDFSKQA